MHGHRSPPGSSTRGSIAIVGGETLLGKEIYELLEARRLDVKLVGSLDSEGSIIAQGSDEPLVMTSLDAADLETARIVILAAAKESGERAWEKIRKAKQPPMVIDLSGALEDLAESRLRAPLLEGIEGSGIEGSGLKASGADSKSPVQTIAHPAAIATALLLTHLQLARPIRRSVIEIFEPVSERGKAGIDELQKQTVALLSFKPLPKEIFDTQAAFNMLSQYGSEAPSALDDIELKIDRHLASLLARSGAPMPSLRLIQAPVFHGYSACLWVEFEENPGMDGIFQALGSSDIDVRTRDHEPPTNVGVAGQSGITVGSITQDRNEPRAWWFWMAADNLQIVAENVGEVVREYLE
jgi:aspartate-semialdehyde dehydrogenase